MPLFCVSEREQALSQLYFLDAVDGKGPRLVHKIVVVGIGDDGLEGLPAAVRQIVEQAELVIASERVHGLLQGLTGETVVADANPDDLVARIEAAVDRRIALVASGDPLFYGLARYLSGRLGKDRFQVIPHVSSMQLAFARVMESWEDAYLADLASEPLEIVAERIRTAKKVGLFTTPACSPANVAEALLTRGIDYFSVYVCENLGSPDERVTTAELAEVAQHQFAALNVMILLRQHDAPDRAIAGEGFRLFGNPEQAFLQSKPKEGLLTPAEVRSLALAEMALSTNSVVWDIGAGSGSVSIEAARLAPGGTAYAIEQDSDDYRLIGENAARFGLTNVVPVLGRAPEAWADLPDPDAVFAQGSGREIGRLCELAFARLQSPGQLVACVASVENLADLHQKLVAIATQVEVRMVQLSRATPQLSRLRFEALNPSFLLSATKS